MTKATEQNLEEIERAYVGPDNRSALLQLMRKTKTKLKVANYLNDTFYNIQRTDSDMYTINTMLPLLEGQIKSMYEQDPEEHDATMVLQWINAGEWLDDVIRDYVSSELKGGNR